MRNPSACSNHASPSCAQEQIPEAVHWRRRQAFRPLKLLTSMLFGFVCVVGAAIGIAKTDSTTDFDRKLRSDTYPRRPLSWVPTYGVDRTVLEEIDFGRLHAQFLLAWVISLQHNAYSRGYARESRCFEALRAQVRADPNLVSLLEALRDRATSGVTANSAEISCLLDGWNAYLGNAGLPWYVAYDLLKTARGGRLYTRSYRVNKVVEAHVSGKPQHLRILVRVDTPNVGELFFGEDQR